MSEAMSRVADAVALLHAGNRDDARIGFAAIWTDIGINGNPLAQCVLAHFMADTQDDPSEELRWDLIALDAADRITPHEAEADHASRSTRDFYPSLHLNLADDYFRYGDLANARRHLDAGRSCLDGFPETGYGGMIRSGLERLAAKLDDHGSRSTVPGLQPTAAKTGSAR